MGLRSGRGRTLRLSANDRETEARSSFPAFGGCWLGVVMLGSVRVVEHLYLHIPFCHRICPYCSFHKHLLAGHEPMEYVRALGAELERESRLHELKPRTIYAGGGTPSLLGKDALRLLRELLEEHLDLSAVEEFDLEANPRTFDEAKASVLHEIGVTRMSLGVQSWVPSELEVLGRDHSPDEAEEAFEILRASGIPRLSLDLMFSVPGQTKKSWAESLERTLSLDPGHVSAYNLTYEEDTEFLERLRKGEFSEDENLDADLYLLAEKTLGKAGFEHYEISNYARSGQRSLHNASYWEGCDYLGLGAGATSTIDGIRWTNRPDTPAYVAAGTAGMVPDRESETLDRDAVFLERLALGLRRVEGIDRGLLEGRPSSLAAASMLESEGLLEGAKDDRLNLTSKGRLVVDPIVVELSGD